MTVEAPASEGAARAQSARVDPSGGDGHCVGQPVYGDAGMAIGGGAVSDLPPPVIAAALHGAVVAQCACVLPTCGDGVGSQLVRGGVVRKTLRLSLASQAAAITSTTRTSSGVRGRMEPGPPRLRRVTGPDSTEKVA